MLQKHVFAFFTRAQLYISSFDCNLLCRHSTPVGTRRRFNVEAWLKFRRDVVSTLIQR